MVRRAQKFMRYTVVVAVILTLSGKFLGFIKDVVLASFFGAGVRTDAYFIANLIPGLVWLAILTTISAAFLPQYVKLKQAGEGEEIAFTQQAVRLYCYLALFLAVVGFVFAKQIVQLSAHAATSETQQLAVTLTRIMVIGFIFTGYVGIQNVLQQVHGRFLSPLVVPVTNNMIMISAIIIASYFDNIAIAVAGAVLAWLLQAPIQRWQTRHMYTVQFEWRVSKQTWRRLSLLSVPIALAVFLDQLNIFIGITIASGFGPGAISHLNYASRLALFAAGLFSWLVSYFFFPSLAENAAKEDHAANGRLLTRGLSIILLTTAPIAAVGLAMRTEIVTLIYGRGAFTAKDVTETAMVFGFYGLGIIFISMREMLNRTFFSYQKTVTPLLIGVGAAIVNLAVSLILSRQIGVAGIAVGATAGALFFSIFQIGLLRMWKPVLITRQLGMIFAIAVAASVISYASARWSLDLITDWHFFARLCSISFVALAVYLVAAVTLSRIARMNVTALRNLMTGHDE